MKPKLSEALEAIDKLPEDYFGNVVIKGSLPKPKKLRKKGYVKAKEKAMRKLEKEISLSENSKEIIEKYGEYLIIYYENLPINVFEEEK